jgi:hypothetical protein
MLQALLDVLLCCRDRKKLPFFLYSYIDNDTVVGRGRGGGLAVWTRADKVRLGQHRTVFGIWMLGLLLSYTASKLSEQSSCSKRPEGCTYQRILAR